MQQKMGIRKPLQSLGGFGVKIGESTVCVMKKQCLAALKISKNKAVNKLEHMQRGQPLILGHLDEDIAKHIGVEYL